MNIGSRLLWITALLCLLGLTIADYPNPGRVTGNVNVHDPAMVRVNGTYYVFCTGKNLEIRRSTDRVNFNFIGNVWPDGAPWTYEFTNNGDILWAPDISYHNGKFFLYYAASTFGSQHSAIFLATSPTALPGSWTNQGMVVQTDSNSDHNAIDPNLIIDPSGNWWLVYGSFWSGIKLVPLDPTTGKPRDGTRYDLARRDGTGAIEAPFIIFRNGWYYLFVSFNSIPEYQTMVGRSRTITGPYVDRNGTPMMNGGGFEVVGPHGNIRGPGHEGLMEDVDGWLLVYHYYTTSDPTTKLGVNLIRWDDDWPFIY